MKYFNANIFYILIRLKFNLILIQLITPLIVYIYIYIIIRELIRNLRRIPNNKIITNLDNYNIKV